MTPDQARALLALLPTKRELFAAMAMQGMLTGTVGHIDGMFSAYTKGPCNKAIVERATAIADLQLAELAKEPKL